MWPWLACFAPRKRKEIGTAEGTLAKSPWWRRSQLYKRAWSGARGLGPGIRGGCRAFRGEMRGTHDDGNRTQAEKEEEEEDLPAYNHRHVCAREPYPFRARPGSPPWRSGGHWGRRRSRRRRSPRRRMLGRARVSRLSCTARLPRRGRGRARRYWSRRLSVGVPLVSWPGSILRAGAR